MPIEPPKTAISPFTDAAEIAKLPAGSRAGEMAERLKALPC